MKRFIEGVERSQGTMFPTQLDEYVSEDNAVRVIDAFIDTLDLNALGFDGAVPAGTGRPWVGCRSRAARAAGRACTRTEGRTELDGKPG